MSDANMTSFRPVSFVSKERYRDRMLMYDSYVQKASAS